MEVFSLSLINFSTHPRLNLCSSSFKRTSHSPFVSLKLIELIHLHEGLSARNDLLHQLLPDRDSICGSLIRSYPPEARRLLPSGRIPTVIDI